MLQRAKKTIRVRTPQHHLLVHCFYDFISISKVNSDKELFLNLCKNGCKNFSKKYCCPPMSPDFKSYVKGYDKLLVLLMAAGLDQLNGFGYKDYHKLRIGNAVLKPRTEKIMRNMERKFSTRFLSTGACRLCKPCRLKLKKPCRYPEKRRYSMESLGVDCNYLSHKLFNMPLLWYKHSKAPEYTCVLCALPLVNSINGKLVINELEHELSQLYSP